jgi:hypothetical protein
VEKRLESCPTFLIAIEEANLSELPLQTRAQYSRYLEEKDLYKNSSNYALEREGGEPVYLGRSYFLSFSKTFLADPYHQLILKYRCPNYI